MDLTAGVGLAMLGAALAVGFPGYGSSIGIGYVGSTAAGLVSDEPEKFGKILLLELLPGTQGIYGFIAFAFILMKVGLLGGTTGDATITLDQGWYFLFASLPIAIAGYGSAIGQGRVAAAGISILAKKPEQLSKAMLLAVMVETYAVFALLATILLINAIQV